MAQLGAYKSNVSPLNVGGVTPHADPSGIPEGIARLGDAIQNRQQQNGIVEASRKMAEARATWTQQLNQAQNDYQPGQDFAGQIMTQFKAYHDQAVKAMSNSFGKKYLDDQLTSFGSQVAQSSIQFQAGAESAGRVQTFKQGISAAGIAVSADPTQFEQVYGEQLSALQAMQIDPETKGNLATSLRDTLSISAAKSIGERDPYGTMLALSKEKTESPVLDKLSMEGRSQVQDHILSVQRMLQAQDDRAMQLADKAQRAASDTSLKDGIKLAQDGKLTPQWIEARHDTWEPQAYEYMYGLLRGKGETTDPHVYAPLMIKAMSGEDVTDDAKGALYSGSIKLDDFNRLLERSQSPRKNWVTRGATYINTAMKTSSLIPDPAGNVRLANAIDDWNKYADANPDADPEKASDRAQAIVRAWALLDLQQAMDVKKRPMFSVINQNEIDVDQSEAATTKALQDGRINPQEATEQALMLRNIRDKQRAAQIKSTTAKPK